MPNRARRSSIFRSSKWTGVLFVLSILLPGVILAYMAVQAADREEAYLEKQYRTALLAELNPVVDRVDELLRNAQAELASTAPLEDTDRVEVLQEWARRSPLVAVPFLFRRSGSFTWPALGSRNLSPSEADFLELNLDFFQDRKSVDVYQNIATEYANQAVVQLEQEKKEQPAPDEGDVEAKAARRQEALGEFERDPGLQKRLYDEAVSRGKSSPKRTLANKASQRVESPEAIPSLFVTESRRFSEIIGENAEGWIPRLVDDRVVLLYWKRLEGGRILGCAVNEQEVRRRMLDLVPVMFSATRVLSVLDHTGAPLLAPASSETRDWRSPFVSRELSGLLPRWEVAAYLSDPDGIPDRARTRAFSVGLLVALLLVSIVIGGVVVARTFQSELRLAEQKTTFVANVSHELKTPLTSIRLFAEMMRDARQSDPEKQRRYLGIMVSETERLTRLINNVLDFSRQDRGGRQYSRRRVELRALCEEVVETQAVRLRHEGFVVETALEGGDAWALVDPEAIKQALVNLISNAEKYSPEEKWIHVSLRVESHGAVSAAVISIADRGMGVRARDAERIFDEFFRADDSLTATVRGTGLGLTLSRRIARDHGGDIVLAEPREAGSVFELRIPLAEGEP